MVKQSNSLLKKTCDILLFTNQCLDNCRKHGKRSDKELWFCDKCILALTDAKILKFSWCNQVNITLCHQFFSELTDLTLVEKTMIARVHLVISILKLRSIGGSNPAAICQWV